jgi:hypothetical protein
VSKSKLSNGKEVRVPAISVVTVPMLMRALGLCATWYAYTKEFDLVQIDPPSDLGDHILGMIAPDHRQTTRTHRRLGYRSQGRP